MVITKELLEKSKELGLNSYESKLWIALLSRGVSTAGELADISNVPRSRTYDVLESLEKKGFIIIKLGKPIKYLAVPPEEVVVRVKKKIKEDADYQSKQLDKLKSSNLIKELNELYSQGVEMLDPTDYTTVIKGKNNIYNHLNYLIKNAKKSIIISGTENSIIDKNNFLFNNLKKASKKGIDIKIITKKTKNNEKYINNLRDIAKIKHSNNKLSRFILVDDSEITFMLPEDKVHPSFDAGVWIKAPTFTQHFSSIFNEHWKNLKEL